MANVSVADILRICGKWIEGKPFASFVAEKMGVKERTAYRNIKKATACGEIKRISLPNRTVLYGLPEFGSPSEDRNATNRAIRQPNVPSSEIDPFVAATIAQQDAIFSLVDFCIKYKLIKSDDPEIGMLTDLYRANRTQLVAHGMMWKVIARLNGYDSFIEYVNDRASRDCQLKALAELLKPK